MRIKNVSSKLFVMHASEGVHSVVLTSGEELEIVDHFLLAAMAGVQKGVLQIVGDAVAPAPAEVAKPAAAVVQDIVVDVDREAKILAALTQIMQSGDKNLFTADGLPKVPSLMTITGFSLTTAERDAALVAYREAQ